MRQREEVTLRIIESDQAEALRGRMLYCSSVDLSATGLQIEVDCEAPEGCVLDMWVEIKGRRGRFYLTGVVRWCRAVEGSPESFAVGIELRASEATEEEDWAGLFAGSSLN